MNEAEKIEETTGSTVEELIERLDAVESALKIETPTQAISKLKAGGQPLIKGFRNNTVILPLAVLQRNMETSSKMTEEAIQQLARNNGQGMQYLMQQIGELNGKFEGLNRIIKAYSNISNVSEDVLSAEVENIKDQEREAAEKQQDETLNRVVVDRAAKEGDVVKISYVGTIDGEEFNGGSAKGFHLTLGSNQFIDTFEEQLVGTSAGDSVEVNVTFPENYGNKELAGKSAVFATEVLAVKEIQNTEE